MSEEYKVYFNPQVAPRELKNNALNGFLISYIYL